MNDLWSDAEIISRYTRAQALEDGVLVDLMQPETEPLVRIAGFKVPVAMTATAFHQTVAPIDGELPAGQDLDRRLWNVLMLLKAAISRAPKNEDRVWFQVLVWNGTKHETVRLWSLCGPGDNAEPVITIMLEGED